MDCGGRRYRADTSHNSTTRRQNTSVAADANADFNAGFCSGRPFLNRNVKLRSSNFRNRAADPTRHCENNSWSDAYRAQAPAGRSTHRKSRMGFDA